MKKVLFIASDNNPASGAFLCMVRLCAILKKKYNIEVKVILRKKLKHEDGMKLLEKEGIPYQWVNSYNWIIEDTDKISIITQMKIQLKKFLNVFAQIQLKKIIKREKFELVHINTTYSYFAQIVAEKCQIPCVWHLREFLEEDQGNRIWNRKRGYQIISKADKVIAISKGVYNKYSSIIPNSKLCMIYDGIDVSKFYLPEKQIFQKELVTFLYIGGLYKGKGVEKIIEAFSILLKEGINNIQLLIVGRGEEEKKLKQLVSKYEVGSKIRFEGYTDTPELYYKQADVMFMGSRAEAFGRVTIEAMLSGMLVIGANVGATTELIQDNLYGVLFEYGNIISMCDCVKHVLNSKSEMQKVADRARRMAYSTFSADINARKIYELYDSIC